MPSPMKSPRQRRKHYFPLQLRDGSVKRIYLTRRIRGNVVGLSHASLDYHHPFPISRQRRFRRSGRLLNEDRLRSARTVFLSKPVSGGFEWEQAEKCHLEAVEAPLRTVFLTANSTVLCVAEYLSPHWYVQLSRSSRRAHEAFSRQLLYRLCRSWNKLPIKSLTLKSVLLKLESLDSNLSGSEMRSLRNLAVFFDWTELTHDLFLDWTEPVPPVGNAFVKVLSKICDALCWGKDVEWAMFGKYPFVELREVIFIMLHKTDPPQAYSCRNIRFQTNMARMGWVGFLNLLRSKSKDAHGRRWYKLIQSARKNAAKGKGPWRISPHGNCWWCLA